VDHLCTSARAPVFFTRWIFGAIFYSRVRYRRRSEHELPHVTRRHAQSRTVIPFGLTMVMYTWSRRVSRSCPP
jgi:hypothetical protein